MPIHQEIFVLCSLRSLRSAPGTPCLILVGRASPANPELVEGFFTSKIFYL